MLYNDHFWLRRLSVHSSNLLGSHPLPNEDEDYILEVHPVDGEGKDAGVIYSEMQVIGYTFKKSISYIVYCRVYFHSTVIEENLYPSSGYLLETGGKLKNLRTSTSNSKIKHYHEHFYRPDNLVLIITGNIKSQDIFDALHKIEDKIVEKRKNKTESLFSRPWKTYLPSLDLKEDLIKEIPFDSDYKNEGSATL